MIMLTNHVIDRARFTLSGAPRHFGDFRKIFLPNIGEGQKKSYHLSATPLALCQMVNPPGVIALRSKKG